LKIIPNPAVSNAVVEIENDLSGDLKIELITTLGQKLFEKNYKKSKPTFSQEIDLGSLNAGVYILQVKISDKIFRKKIIKE
jgi:hypothetical protein